METLGHEQLVALDAEHVFQTYGRQPVAFVRGEGTHLWDTEGREYLDFLCGLAVTSLGHAHPTVAAAIAVVGLLTALRYVVPGAVGIPLLWRFHAIHHSTEVMDWLAGSRLHFADAVITRSLTYVPLFLLGFSEKAIAVYVVVVVIQATFIHANVRWQFPILQRWVATPCFHHWHHAAEREAVDKNFAVHSPIWDWLFGTYYMPGRWPHRYGLCGPRDVPSGWLPQFLYPFLALMKPRRRDGGNE